MTSGEDGGASDGGPSDGGTSVTLVPQGVVAPLTLSPDGKWLQIASVTNGSLTNMNLASATTPGPLTNVWPQATAYPPLGFSADSKYEAFGTNYPMNFGITNFDIEASPVSGGAATKVLTSAGTLAFTTGSKLVTNVNATATTGSADIESVDLANPAAASTLVTQADPNFFYASTSNQVFYTWYCAPTSASGVWVVPAP